MKILTLAALLLIPFILSAQKLTIKNDQVKVKFEYLSKDTDGTFSDFKADIYWDAKNLEKSKIEGSVGVETIDTGIGLRDRHLKASSYFDVDKYPRITFESKRIVKSEEGFKVIGDVTIKDTTKEMEINFIFDGNKFVGKSYLYSDDFDIMGNKNREKTKVAIEFEVPVK